MHPTTFRKSISHSSHSLPMIVLASICSQAARSSRTKAAHDLLETWTVLAAWDR